MKRKRVERIGVLTGGGDCPGLNAVLRSVVKTAQVLYGVPVFGIEDGYHGLIYDRMRLLTYEDVSNILTHGGTILGASNKDNPFRQPVLVGKKWEIRNCVKEALANVKKNKLDALITVGGDGTQNIAFQLSQLGVPVIGIPKTIDNDLEATEVTVGFATAVATATQAIDKIHTTALSHHRVMVVELMGRYAGWLALYAGVASGGDIILIPEIQFDLEKVCRKLVERNRRGKRFSIVVVAEGARPKGKPHFVKARDFKRTDPIQLGGVGENLARAVEEKTGLETRVTVLGHVVRGGSPVAEDRLLATLFGKTAVDALMKGQLNQCVVIQRGQIRTAPIAQAVSRLKLVPRRHPFVLAAQAVGTYFGY